VKPFLISIVKVMVNTYYTLKLTDQDIDKNVHRNLVGGLWEEIGILTLNFLREYAGMKPDHKILDLGCGSFRCGIPIMKFLNANNYYAIDINADLVKAGFVEIRKSGLESKISRDNIRINDNFDTKIFRVKFDIVLAQSLWTHLPLNHIKRSLSMVEKVLSSEGSFYTTFFLCPEEYDLHKPFRHQPGDVITYRDRDPYHYRLKDFEHLIHKLNSRLKMSFIGDWNHPRNQFMLCFKE
jgi:cyclopropane fatty-acyl-phospholipid synthase-like methyltransferase